MKHWEKSTFRMTAIAAAVGLALGSATVLAQSSEAQSNPASQQLPLPSQQRQSSDEGFAQPQSEQTQASENSSTTAEQGGALDALAQEHSDLSTFVHAIKAAGLERSLTSGTHYTVFAPTNDAFESMHGKSLDELMKPENRDELIGVLRAHIVADDVDPQMAAKIDKAETIDGGTVDLKSEDGNLMVGDAKVVDANGIDIDNLRVYAIDNVLASNATSASASLRSARTVGSAG